MDEPTIIITMNYNTMYYIVFTFRISGDQIIYRIFMAK